MAIVSPHITGLGLITPLGAGCAQTFQSLMDGKFVTAGSATKFVCDGKENRIRALALAAARQAMRQASWQKWPDSAAIIVGTSKGNVEACLADIENIQNHQPANYPWKENFGLGDLASALAEELGAANCIRLTYSAACASALHAVARAVLLIRAGEARAALVVAAESSLHPLFQGCFDRLGVLATPGTPCRPFDQNRRGFHISEAAAAICLETPIPGKTQPAPIAVIDHVALAGDAWHLTASDPHGRVLRNLLQRALANENIDLIHAHGTGTQSNDIVELAAIESALRDSKSPPILYSHKAALGHSLGASGLVSLVINCLCHQHGSAPGNICTTDPLPAPRLVLSPHTSHRPIRGSLVLAGGFGGATAVLRLRFNDSFRAKTL